MTDLLIALLAGVGAGMLNAVVGAGTLVTYPALLALGLSPLTANVTSAVGIFPGSLSGAYTYRATLRSSDMRGIVILATVAMVSGALIGIPLLLLLPDDVFASIVPWLIVAAGALTVAQPWLTRRAAHGSAAPQPRRAALVVGICGAGVYLSYFGAATGVITLSVLLFIGIRDLQVANGIKNLATGIANGLIAVMFLIVAPVEVHLALAIAVGSTLGGLLGGRIAQRLSPSLFRGVIALVAVVAATAAFLT